MAGPYITKANLLILAKLIKSDLSDIPDDFMTASTEIIENRTKVWEVTAVDQYLDGRGENYIFCPITPIVTLTALKIIAEDTTEESLDVSGSDRQIWFNDKTGLIKRIDGEDNILYGEDGETSVFPHGVKNIKLSGTFGVGPYKILSVLQTMLVFQMLGVIYPTQFRQMDIIEEKIGEYSYRLGDNQYAKDPNNTKKGIDGYIEFLFNALPKDEYKDMVLAV